MWWEGCQLLRPYETPGLERNSEGWAGAVGGRGAAVRKRGPVGPIPQPSQESPERAQALALLSGVWPPLSTAAPHAGPGRGGRAAPASARLAQFSNPGPSQPLPQHRSCEPDDPTAAPERLGESEGPHAKRRAEDP